MNKCILKVPKERVAELFIKSDFFSVHYLKSDSHHPNKILFIYFSESPLNLLRHNLVKKELQYTYYRTSHEVKTARHLNLVRWKNVTRQIFFFKNHAENEAGRLVPGLFLFFKKALFEVNAIGLQLSFNQFR